MKPLLPILFLFLSLTTYAQEEQSNYALDAEFVYGPAELDSFVRDNFVRPRYCLEKGIGFDIWMQFTVDSISGISFVRVMDIKPQVKSISEELEKRLDTKLIPYLKTEARRVIKATAGLWIPRELEGKPTWQVIDYRIEIKTPEYYSKWEHYRRHGSMATVNHTPLDTPSDNAKKYYNLGVKKMNQKKHYIAIKYFKKSLSMGNVTKDVYYNLGVAQYLYGLKQDACKSWNKAFDLGDTEAKELIEENCE